MSFKRFVEIGRVALVTYGEDAGKLCTIVDVIDGNRVLVDGPKPITGVARQALGLARIQLTDLKVAAKLNCGQKALVAAWKEAGTEEAWKSSNQYKKRNARALRAGTTDFERFQITIAKKKRAALRKKA